MSETRRFYDELADDYHLLFEDWEASMRRQGEFLSAQLDGAGQRVLDIACGMGTQAIGLALEGHEVVARDLSPRLVQRARAAAERLDASLRVEVGDMRVAQPDDAGRFDAVIACDNPLPHLESEAHLRTALSAVHAALVPGGLFFTTTRDYDHILEAKPDFDPPRLLGSGHQQRIVLQLWTWQDERRYDFEHIILSRDSESGWRQRVRTGRYRGFRRAELTTLLEEAGFGEIEWTAPEPADFAQAILRARVASG